MNKEQFKGKWAQLQGNIQKQWGKLTDSDLEVIKGDARVLVGKLQEKYGISKEKAEKKLKNFKCSQKNKATME